MVKVISTKRLLRLYEIWAIHENKWNYLRNSGTLCNDDIRPFISVTDAELKRLKEAFKRVSTLNGCITKQSFIKDVLGEGVPTPVAEVSLYFVLPVCSFI
jgi:hypothetical protein